MQSWFFRYVARLDRVFGSVSDAARLRRADPFQRWTSPGDVGRMRVFFARGTQDREGIAPTNDAFHDHLVLHGVPHRYVVFDGGHRWEDWKPIFPNAIRYALGEEARAISR
jgi:enterochelin esterase-like enzyme